MTAIIRCRKGLWSGALPVCTGNDDGDFYDHLYFHCVWLMYEFEFVHSQCWVPASPSRFQGMGE